MIYTGSQNLPEITEKVKIFLETDNFISLKPERDVNNCCLTTKNIRIQVVFKGVQNPEQSGHPFRFKADSHSGAKRTPIPF